MLRIITLVLILSFGTAFAQSSSGPYKAIPTGDGAWKVSKDGGKTQVGGVYTTKASAEKAAKKTNRKDKKLKKSLDKDKKK